jgi:hypothetical protein
MINSLGKFPRQYPIKCWGCEGDEKYKDCTHKGDNMQVDYQSHVIQVEGKIDNHPISILIDSRSSHI